MVMSNSQNPATTDYHNPSNAAPQIQKAGEILRVTNLPADKEARATHIAAFENILHQLKHYACHGTIKGRKAAMEMEKAGIPPENREYRLGISYIVSDGADGLVQINLLWNTACEPQIFDDKCPDGRPMEEAEIQTYFEKVINLCRHEIDLYLQEHFPRTAEPQI